MPCKYKNNSLKIGLFCFFCEICSIFWCRDAHPCKVVNRESGESPEQTRCCKLRVLFSVVMLYEKN